MTESQNTTLDLQIVEPNAENAQLVAVVDGELVADSRRVAEKFGKRHDNVLQAVRNLDCSGEFAALNFKDSEYVDPTGRSSPQILMTRDGFSFLVMGFTGKSAAKWKEAYISAFNALEQRGAAEFQPDNPDHLLKLANRFAEEKKLLQEENRQLETRVEEMKPAQAALRRIEHAEGTQCFTTAAKVLKVRLKDLTAFMHAEGWIFRRQGRWEGYAAKIKQGLVFHKETTVTDSSGYEKIAVQCRLTAKGISRLAQMLNETRH